MLDKAQPTKPLPDLRYPFLIFSILMRNIGFLVPFAGAWVHLRFLVVSWLLIFFSFLCCVFCFSSSYVMFAQCCPLLTVHSVFAEGYHFTYFVPVFKYCYSDSRNL